MTSEVVDFYHGTHEAYWDADNVIRHRRRRRPRPWMQAHDARAEKRRQDIELVISVVVGLLVLFGACVVPLPST